MLLLGLWVSVDRVSMMCADLMMRRARLFGPLLASGCEVLISGEGTRRVRLFDGERALVGNATAKLFCFNVCSTGSAVFFRSVG